MLVKLQLDTQTYANYADSNMQIAIDAVSQWRMLRPVVLLVKGMILR